MIEDNKNEDKQLISQETINEETTNKEVVNEDEIKNENNKGKKKNRIGINLIAGVIDQVVVIAISLLVFVIVDFALPFVGFYIAQRDPVFLIIYVIINILYGTVCETTKMKKTIGKKVLVK